MIKNDDLLSIANDLVLNLKKEFEVKHMSKNLINTIKIVQDPSGVHVVIPAEKYNMRQFQLNGVVIHTGTGSYAQKLDEEGSQFYVYQDNLGQGISANKGRKLVKPGNHKGFIKKNIDKTMNDFINKKSLKVVKKEEKRV